MLRAVVDTNVWISALLNPRGHPAQVLKAFRDGRFVAILSQPLVDVLARPRIVDKYRLEPQDVAQFVTLIRERSESVNPSGTFHLCRDPRDDIVLETALIGNASCIVSRDDDIKGDDDLVEAMHAHGVRVRSVSEFLAAIAEHD